jgi:acetoacetate decarboxylase
MEFKHRIQRKLTFMRAEDIRKNAFAMPLGNPSYNKGPVRFVNREFIIITYRTDRELLEKIIPEPLQLAEPLVKYEFINMPDSSGLGSYTETGQVIPVTFNGEAGGFTHAMYLNNFPGIVIGRELLGFPKVLAQPRLEVRGDFLVGTLDYNGMRVATATMRYKKKEIDKATALKSLQVPGFLLKIIPHVDGTHRICELVRYQAHDVVVKGAWTGVGTLELHPHCEVPVANLPVREVVSAVHMLTDLTLEFGEVVYDYLADNPSKGK